MRKCLEPATLTGRSDGPCEIRCGCGWTREHHGTCLNPGWMIPLEEAHAEHLHEVLSQPTSGMPRLPADQTPTPSLAEYRRMAAENDNWFWYLQSGDHLNLLEEAIEENDRLRAENAKLTTQLYNRRQCAVRELEAQVRGDEAEEERDALAAKLDAANARVAELEELKCSVCGLRVAHLNANGFVIGWGCANGDNCKDDRLVQARASGWDEGYKSGAEDERTSADNIGIAGFGMKVNPARVNPYRRLAPESPRPPAEATVERPASPDGGTETGTPVSERHGSAQASDWPNVDGWTLWPHPDGIGLYHSCDSRAFLTGPEFPVGAVLAYIADPPVPDGEPGYIAEAVACPACRAQSTEEDTDER